LLMHVLWQSSRCVGKSDVGRSDLHFSISQ
jgi:hypothetical protein